MLFVNGALCQRYIRFFLGLTSPPRSSAQYGCEVPGSLLGTGSDSKLVGFSVFVSFFGGFSLLLGFFCVFCMLFVCVFLVKFVCCFIFYLFFWEDFFGGRSIGTTSPLSLTNSHTL